MLQSEPICQTRGFMPYSLFKLVAMRLTLLCLVCVAATPATLPASETLNYSVEWKLIEAGKAVVSSAATTVQGAPGSQLEVKLNSVGLVSRLYKVDNLYRVSTTGDFCATEVFAKSNEGSRRRETRIAFDSSRNKASYLEQDLVKNSVVLQKEIDVPACAYDIMGGLFRLRHQQIPLGHFIDLPMSDGKKFVKVKVEAQEREKVKTPAGTFQAIRYEAFIFNNQLFARKARMFIWISDDERRLPVQIRVRLGLAVGTITVQLAKDEPK